MLSSYCLMWQYDSTLLKIDNYIRQLESRHLRSQRPYLATFRPGGGFA